MIYQNADIKFWTIIVLLIMIVVPCKAQTLEYSKDHPLIVGLDADYPPLEYVGEDGIPKGFDVEFTKLLMQRLGIPFIYAPNSWEQISGDVLQGRVDLGMMIYSDYRKDITNYSRPVFRMYYQLVYRKADDNKIDQRNLRGKRVAYMNSRPIGEMLTKQEAIKTSVTNLEQAILDLSAGKFDAVICFRYQTRYFLSRHNLTDLKADELSMHPREYCYVSHNQKLIEVINEELKRMEEGGIVDDVYGEEVKSSFGKIEIPHWIWYLLAATIILSLIITSIIRYKAQKKLEAEHAKLLKAYDLLAENNEALVVANGRAEESSRMKSDFIKQISHEIRTPLNVLSGFAQVLTREGIDLDENAYRDISHRIADNAERITQLVNKMLELSDASSQTVIEKSDRVSATSVATQSITEMGIETNSRFFFEFKVDPVAETAVVNTNLRMASRVLVLLLDNAKKFLKSPGEDEGTFTVPGTIVLHLSCPSDNVVAYAVEDTGIGVPAEEAERIFDEFVQLDEYYDGTGLGLTVARSIARRMDGDVVLDTSYTNGARFVFTLPMISNSQLDA